jgi:hypothetical protein
VDDVILLRRQELVDEALQHTTILHLAEPEDIGSAVAVDPRDGAGEVLHLRLDPLVRPAVPPLRQELLIVDRRIIAGVEQILHVVEADDETRTARGVRISSSIIVSIGSLGTRVIRRDAPLLLDVGAAG